MKLKAIAVLLIASNALGAPTYPPGVSPVHYVSPDGAHVPPFTTWANAANDIQSAVDASSSNDTILVADGVYDTGGAVTPGYVCMNRVCITKSITVQSLNGPKFTYIVGADNRGGVGPDAVRGVYMSSGMLSGFTITNGHTQSYDSYDRRYDLRGGGVNMHGGDGVVTNCVLVGNMSRYNGGGSYGGTLNNCTLTGNSALSRSFGGGSFGSTLNNCTLTGNSANYGGGSSGSTLNNCTLTGNSAYYGGGSYGDTLTHCTLMGNVAKDGGGSRYGKLYNCTLYHNLANDRGGGCFQGTLVNCTITGNSANYGGGCGASDTRLKNCIVYYNTASRSGDNWYSTRPMYSYTCTTPNPGGDGNITNAPAFIDPDAGNFRILATSPCIDAGSNDFVSEAVDIDGNPRIIDGDLDGVATVDMGAYEFQLIEISIEIKLPTINLGSKGRCPVAVLSTDAFYASEVDPASVRFADTSPVHSSLEDMDEDGDIDLVLHFMTRELTIDPADTEAMLIGQTYSGQLLVGTDSIKIVPSK